MKSAGSELATIEPKPRRKPAKPNDRDWPGLRAEYEQSGKVLTLRYISERDDIPLSTLEQRCWREGWKKREAIVRDAFKNLETTINGQATKIVEDELAPWIESQKAKFIKRSFATANRGVSRVARHQRDNKERVDARDEANIAKALESFTRVGRTALGMSDGTTAGGPLNFTMLSNKTAIQISAPESVERP